MAELLEDPRRPASPPPISARAIILGSGPRFARDAFGPVLAFYVLWKLGGLVPAIVGATVMALAAWQWERRHERPGLMARISLVLVLLQAAVGLLADDAKVYLAQPVLVGGVYALAFLVSAVIGRPLAGSFASEMYPFPPEVRVSQTFRTVFGRISVAWGTFLLVRAVVRMLTLSSFTIDGFVVVSFISGAPLTAALLTWSVWYGRRAFERSEEWGWAFAGPEAVAPVPDPVVAPLRDG